MKKRLQKIASEMRRRNRGWIPALLLLSCPLSGSAMEGMDHSAHQHHEQHQSAAPVKPEMAQVDLVSEVLQSQYGQPVNLTDDIGKHRILVMNFVYTTCTTVCPVTSAVFEQLQAQLQAQESLGSEVMLVSVTVDPVRDTPQKLKDYAGRFHAGKDWLWLTGEKRRVDRVLEGLGAYTPDFRDHPAMVLVGEPSSNRWMRFFGFPSPEKILATIEDLKMPSNETLAGHRHDGHVH